MAVVIGLAATITRARLKRRTLKIYPLRWEWLVFFAVLPQVLIFQIPAIGRLVPEEFIPYVLILSMLGLLVFCTINLIKPGFWALELGLFSNFLVIFLNGGWMPIHRETIQRMEPGIPVETWELNTRLGLTKDRILSVSETKLFYLSDIFTVPHWFPYRFAFSIGDIFISIGVILVLWSLSRKQEELS